MLPKIKELLDRKTESEFLALLRQKTSRNAAAPMIMIKLFEGSQPGYYGPKGGELISEIVMGKYGDYIRKSGDLYNSLKFCGGVMGYISAVIVPEVGVQLIMEDEDIKWDEARKIMRASIPYGNVKNPSEDDD
jgi:hypothetical protein